MPLSSDRSEPLLCATSPTHATSLWGHLGYTRGVERVLDYIRDGDCYQVNLAHTLVAPFEGSPRAAFATLAERADPPFAMYVEAPPESLEGGGTRHFAMLSLSPELFLDYDAATRRVITRPMKGTRPCVPGAHEELEASEKDRAELAMIVDLMRNDLGRVCEVGSVRVDVPRRIERHDNAAGGVWQAIAQVSGTLRDECDAADLIAATFPAGSVTGAPKIRAMQIIDELEPEPRGIYCGSGIHIRADGSMTLSVAIRTALIEGVSHDDGTSGNASDADTSRSGGVPTAPTDHIRGTLRYSVGAGIVADSVPDAEWRETLVKAGPLGGLVDLRAVATDRCPEDRT
ncbi:MAG: anthranilate synthase component I family protein [Planctomycetota bacterium]|nr:anthranilate synthase component I family protein [Planctomycetota bacterium]